MKVEDPQPRPTLKKTIDNIVSDNMWTVVIVLVTAVFKIHEFVLTEFDYRVPSNKSILRLQAENVLVIDLLH